MNQKRPAEHMEDDLGLGVKAAPVRWVNQDGSFNVRRTGLALVRPDEFYHHLITMGGVRFLVLVFLGYLATNLVFAALYLWVGMEHFTRAGGAGFLDRALDAFFFSAQTLTTVGYGQISPMSHLASAVAALESLLGLLSFALATGLLYGRFSRPRARLVFSREALVAPYRGGAGLMFRLANGRSSQMVELEATVVLSFLDPDAQVRRFKPLVLERARISLLPTTWTVVHPIDRDSPLWGLGPEDLERSRVEFIVLVKAFDETFVQTLYQRTSYIAKELRWSARFRTMGGFGSDGRTEVDLARVDDWDPAVLEDAASAGQP
jgi:inward rectifier potassium channel